MNSKASGLSPLENRVMDVVWGQKSVTAEDMHCRCQVGFQQAGTLPRNQRPSFSPPKTENKLCPSYAPPSEHRKQGLTLSS